MSSHPALISLTRPSRFMACRSQVKAEDAISEIRKQTPKADVHFLPYDASSLSLAHSCGLSFLTHNLPLDILILNAGTITDGPRPTKDGLEPIFATNHLAHWVLTMTLLPALEKAAKLHGDVRVSTTTSAGFNMHPDPESLHVGEAELTVGSDKFWWKGAMPMYGRSKTCNILFAAELSRRLRSKTSWGNNVRSNAVHPGTVGTGLNRSLRTSWYFTLLETFVYAFASVSRFLGSATLLFSSAILTYLRIFLDPK